MSPPNNPVGPVINPDGSLGGLGKVLAGNTGVIIAGASSEGVLLLQQNFGLAISPHLNIAIQTVIGLIAVGYGVFQAHPDWVPTWWPGHGRYIGRVAKLAPVLLLGIFLAGCASQPTPPPTPAPPDVTAEAASLNTYTGSPAQYFNLAVAVNKRWCNTYLNNLTTKVNQSDFLSSSASLAGTAATGIATASGAGILPLAIMGIAFPTISEELKAEGREATGGVDPRIVLPLIQKQQKAYLDGLAAGPPLADLTQADMLIADFSLICQPAGIGAAVASALNGATATTAPAQANLALRATEPGTAAPGSGIYSPPLVVVH